ncbi:MAG: peptide chain release factor N(5)-glutamine methyltransferase [Clostridia bacterium]|nr:peptide chain release factor N(5)-glutamine methyltransferase [Clostridia bacterium]
MTYRDICNALAAVGIESPSDDAALLIEHFCGVERAALVLCRERDFESEALACAVKKRAEHYPLQYILGRWGFYDSDLAVAEGVLIPRADTELLVEQAIKQLPHGARFADIGCGSGCISVSILRARPDTVAVAVDISPTARALTVQNAENAGVRSRLEVVNGDMREEALWGRIGELDAVISNPPYIPTDDITTLAPELAFEPTLALDGGRDGLDFYRALIQNSVSALKQGGFMLFECGVGQTADIAAIAADSGYESEIYFDIENRDRAIRILLPSPKKERDNEAGNI